MLITHVASWIVLFNVVNPTNNFLGGLGSLVNILTIFVIDNVAWCMQYVPLYSLGKSCKPNRGACKEKMCDIVYSIPPTSNILNKCNLVLDK